MEKPLRLSPVLSSSRAMVEVWDVPTRLFHWLFAAMIVFAYFSAEEESALRQWHMAAGYTVTVLLVFRIAWGFLGGEFARFASFVHPSRVGRHMREMFGWHLAPTQGHNPLGGVAVLLMLLLAAASVATGVLLKGEGPHELFGKMMIMLAGVHVLAVLLMSWLSRENLPRAMVTGRKPLPAGASWSDARTPRPAALLVALLLALAAAVAIRAYDPDAFGPQQEEHGEHGRGGVASESEGDED